jgi:hypothetical protein
MSLPGKFRKMNLGEMSPEDKRKSKYGDEGQGNRLIQKKFDSPAKAVDYSYSPKPKYSHNPYALKY